uniref:Ig-like domain-containing protein n=1 Tax=Callorhinchus milii TaxID=7868 RepID=A0A4W3GP59_CALMI
KASRRERRSINGILLLLLLHPPTSPTYYPPTYLNPVDLASCDPMILCVATFRFAGEIGIQCEGNQTLQHCCVGRAPKPTLIVDPPSGDVILGDNVTFTCTAPEYAVAMTFTLYKLVGEIKLEKLPPVNVSEVVFQITGINSKNDGSYHCVYDIPRPRFSSLILSEFSDYVRLTVRGFGGSVTLTCTAPSSVSPSQFTLYREDQPVRQSPHTGLVKVFEIKAINASDEGSYRCRYQTAQSVKSLPSPRVPLTVRGEGAPPSCPKQ